MYMTVVPCPRADDADLNHVLRTTRESIRRVLHGDGVGQAQFGALPALDELLGANAVD